MKSSFLDLSGKPSGVKSARARDKRNSIQLLPAKQVSNSRSSSFLMRMASDIKRRRSIQQILEKPETPMPMSTGKVFDRLLHDSNRRQISRQRLAQMAQEKFEEEISQLQLKRTIHTKSTRVFDRLFSDSQLRITLKNQPVLEKSISSATSNRDTQQKNAERLSTPRNEAYNKWNQLKNKREEQIFAQIEEIRRKRHPQRAIDLERNKRLASPRSVSPRTKAVFVKPTIKQIVFKPWKRMMDLDDSMTRLKVKTRINE